MRMTPVAVSGRDLVLAYGGHIALAASSFDVPKGRVTAVIGPNGSGKSTLLSAIGGLIEPESGILDVAASESGSRGIAYVLQTTKVNTALPISVREVVMMGRYSGLGLYRWITQRDREAVDEAMERTGIADLAARPLHDLSGGQRQRVLVAQGLVQEHDLLLLDEPLTGLDLPAAQAIDQLIHDEVNRGCTVLLTTHDLSEAGIAEHVLLLSGRVVASGTPQEVLTNDNLSAAYGPGLLHGQEGQIFIDDPAHRPVAGRHVHRDRTIHTEARPSEQHRDH